MKKSILIMMFELCLANFVSAQSNELSFLQNTPLKEHFNTSDFDGGIQSWSFDQDNSGILYIANNKGLLEFDGRKWNRYDVPLSTRLRAVKVDQQNRIFVGGQGQIGYFSKNSSGFVFTSLLGYLGDNQQIISETWKILEFEDKILFNTESNLFSFKNDTVKAIKLPGYLRYTFAVGNRLFAQFYNMGIYELKNDKFNAIAGTSIEHDIIAILPHKKHYYCFTREGEIYLFNASGLTRINTSTELGIVNVAIRLKSGEYAIGTQSNGIYIFTPNFTLKKQLTKGKGLSDRTVKALYEDQFENLWVALNTGIDYLKLSLPFSIINEEFGVEGTGYAAIKHKDQIYLGTNNGAFTQKKTSNKQRPFELISGSEGQMYSFSTIEDALFLNQERGASILKKEQLEQVEGIGSWKFMNTHIPNTIIGGGHRGISFFKRKKGKWLKANTIENLDESSRIIEFENDSTFWMTHVSKGAFRIEFDSKLNVQKKITRFGKKEGFPSNTMINVYSLNNKLIFTSESGIFDFNSKKGSFTPNNYLNELLGNEHISTVSSNGTKSIYYIQNQKFGKLTQKSFGTHEKHTSIFKHINKYLNDDLPNVSILNRKNILIGAKEGFILYNPDKKITIKEDFKVLLRTIKIASPNDPISERSSVFDKGVEINRTQSIKFEYAAPYFEGFEDLKYSCRLLPLNKQWSNWSDLGEKEYTHLPSGKYTLELKALNIYELESDITTFSFEVSTPWFLSKWAILSYLLLGILTLTLLPMLQRKRFKKEKTILYEDKAKEIKVRDKEINKLENEKLKTEIDLRNDQLTSITMDLVKNNDFILSIQNEITDSLEQINPSKGMKRIIKNIDRELSKDDSWDKFAYHFDQVHGNYLKKLADNNIKLSPREIKLAAFLRMNMSSKEISAMLNITTRGTELARYRLRKKLKLKRDQNLVEYLISLDSN